MNTANVQRLKKKVFFFGNCQITVSNLFHFFSFLFLTKKKPFIHFNFIGLHLIESPCTCASIHIIHYQCFGRIPMKKMFHISILLLLRKIALNFYWDPNFTISNPIKNKIILFKFKTDLSSCPWILRPKKYRFRWWHFIYSIQWTFRQKSRWTTNWISCHRSSTWIGIGRLFVDSCQEFLHRPSNQVGLCNCWSKSC